MISIRIFVAFTVPILKEINKDGERGTTPALRTETRRSAIPGEEGRDITASASRGRRTRSSTWKEGAQ